MSNKKQKILKNYMLAILIFFLIYSIIDGVTHDNYFIAATGKYILDNGMPYTNPFTINEGLPFVCQQWLFCVIYYLIDCIPMGANIFTMLGIALMIWLSMKLTKSDLDTKSHLLIIMASLCIVYSPLITHRPEWVTVVLLLTQIIIQEKSKDNPKLLYFLPLIAIAEINLHASMWIMHACLLVPYFLPFGKLKPVLKVTKHAVIATILSAAALFLNPYGWDNIIYLFTSTQRMHRYGIEINEMQSPIFGEMALAEAAGAIVAGAALIAMLIINCRMKKHTSAEIYICIGLLICGAMSKRNSMFLYIAILIIAVQFFSKDNISKFTQSKIWKEYKIIPIIIVPIVSAYVIFAGTVAILYNLDPVTFKNLITIKNRTILHDPRNLYEYDLVVDMLKREDEDPRVSTMSEYGSYLAYKGIYNVSSTCNIEQYLIEDKNGHIPIVDYCIFGLGNLSDEDIAYYDIDYFILLDYCPENRKKLMLEYGRWSNNYDGQYMLREDLDLDTIIIFESTKHYEERQRKESKNEMDRGTPELSERTLASERS